MLTDKTDRQTQTDTDRQTDSLAYLQCSHPDHLIGVVEEVGKYVEDGGFGQDQFLRTKDEVARPGNVITQNNKMGGLMDRRIDG